MTYKLLIKNFFKYKNLKIVSDGIISTKGIPGSSIDLIVTSPPYS